MTDETYQWLERQARHRDRLAQEARTTRQSPLVDSLKRDLDRLGREYRAALASRLMTIPTNGM